MENKKKDRKSGRDAQNSLCRLGQRIHKGWAAYMASLCGRMSLRSQKLVFISVFAGTGIYCLLLLSGSGVGGLPDTGRVRKLHLQGSAPETAALRLKLDGLKGYLDSLSTTRTGIRKRDSILLRNPGLLDSITLWERQLEHLENKL